MAIHNKSVEPNSVLPRNLAVSLILLVVRSDIVVIFYCNIFDCRIGLAKQ